MATFLLLHGAGHDGWCWSSVAAALRARGHRAEAPDLPCDRPNAGIEDYAQVAVAAVTGAERPLVVVGHSLGALTAAVAAERLAADHLVFLAGLIPQPGRSLEDLAEADTGRLLPMGAGDIETDELGRSRFTPAGARRLLYHDCAPAVSAEACAHLRYQCSLWSECLPIADWPAARIHSIVCRDDRVIAAEWLRRTSRERLGVEPLELPGGHSPMLSRPDDLVGMLLDRVTS